MAQCTGNTVPIEGRKEAPYDAELHLMDSLLRALVEAILAGIAVKVFEQPKKPIVIDVPDEHWCWDSHPVSRHCLKHFGKERWKNAFRIKFGHEPTRADCIAHLGKLPESDYPS